ncbi:hypothetical protein JXA12_04050 [Candidatus Woesearchaeota archaeon]|nr:hypothetical protein [Candidatus Woesearchaeota archaeon]
MDAVFAAPSDPPPYAPRNLVEFYLAKQDPPWEQDIADLFAQHRPTTTRERLATRRRAKRAWQFREYAMRYSAKEDPPLSHVPSTRIERLITRKQPPWEDRIIELFQRYEPQSMVDRSLYRGHAATEWHAANNGKRAERQHRFWNDVIVAAGYQGALYEEGSKNLENLTGKSAAWAAEKNALWWTPIAMATEHLGAVAAVFSTEKAALGHGELAAIPLAYAGIFAGYNAYRYHQAKQHGKALPNIGYTALWMNFKELVHQNSSSLLDMYARRGKQEGTSAWYAGLESLVENVTNSFRARQDKQPS